MKTYSKRPGSEEILRSVSCPVCGSEDVRPLWDLGEFAFARCRGCGHVYQNPRPRPSDLAARYDGEYLKYEIRNADTFLNLMELGLHDLGFDRIEAGLPEGKTFLDVGCATGALVARASGRGWYAQGVEICGPAAEYARNTRGVPVFTGTLDEAAFPEDSFDFVHTSHVIEHIAEPREFVTEIGRILKPNGWCEIVTPNTASLQARLFRGRWRSAIADHVHLFSLHGLRRVLSETGLIPERWITWGGMARGLAPAPIKAVLDSASKIFGFGDVMAVLARKPPR